MVVENISNKTYKLKDLRDIEEARSMEEVVGNVLTIVEHLHDEARKISDKIPPYSAIAREIHTGWIDTFLGVENLLKGATEGVDTGYLAAQHLLGVRGSPPEGTPPPAVRKGRRLRL